jgi:hypothetical protein
MINGTGMQLVNTNAVAANGRRSQGTFRHHLRWPVRRSIFGTHDNPGTTRSR